MSVLLLTEEDVAQVLPIEDAIQAVHESFVLLGRGEAVNGTRIRTRSDQTLLTTRMAIAPSLGAMGLKVYPIVRTDVTRGAAFTMLIYTLPGGELDAVIAADLLGRRRTGGASAVAASKLARPDSTNLAIFGVGDQSRAQVAALSHVLPGLAELLVVGRSPARIDTFVADMKDTTDLAVHVVEPDEAAARADVIVTVTGSSEPVFSGSALGPCNLIIAAGSNFAEKREIDRTTVERASAIVVDSLEVARVESGDLLRNGYDDWANVKQMGDVVNGLTEPRGNGDGPILFESHGLGLQDLVCAVRVVRESKVRHLGTVVEI